MFIPRTVMELDIDGHLDKDESLQAESTLESGLCTAPSIHYSRNVLRTISLSQGCVAMLHLPNPPSDFQRYRSLLELILSTVAETSGTVHPIPLTTPNVLFITWGVVQPAPMTPSHLGCIAISGLKNVQGIAAGVGAGRLQAGVTGGNSMRSFYMIGPAADTAVAAAEIALETQDGTTMATQVVSVTVQHSVSIRFDTVPVGAVNVGGRASMFYALLEQHEKKDWMNDVVSAASTHEHLTRLISCITAGKATTADIDEYLSIPPSAVPTHYDRYVTSRLRHVRCSPAAFVLTYRERNLHKE